MGWVPLGGSTAGSDQHASASVAGSPPFQPPGPQPCTRPYPLLAPSPSSLPLCCSLAHRPAPATGTAVCTRPRVCRLHRPGPGAAGRAPPCHCVHPGRSWRRGAHSTGPLCQRNLPSAVSPDGQAHGPGWRCLAAGCRRSCWRRRCWCCQRGRQRRPACGGSS